MKKSLLLFAVALTAITAFAQPDPNVAGQPAAQPGVQQGGGRQGFDITAMVENQVNQAETTMILTDAGVFLYKAGTLAKLDYLTLTEQKKVALFGAMPVKPAAQAAGGNNGGFMAPDPATQKYIAEVTKRLAPPTIITTEDAMFIVVGDSFFKVSQLTLAIDLQSDLAKKADPAQPADPNAGGRIMGGFNFGRTQQNGAPVVKINDNVMVILKQNEIMLVDTLTGKVSIRNTVPKDFITNQNAFGQGGRQGNNAAGGGRQGNNAAGGRQGGGRQGGGAAAGGAAPAVRN